VPLALLDATALLAASPSRCGLLILCRPARHLRCRAEVLKLHGEVARLRQALREGEQRLAQQAGEGSGREAQLARLQLELRDARQQLEVGACRCRCCCDLARLLARQHSALSATVSQAWMCLEGCARGAHRGLTLTPARPAPSAPSPPSPQLHSAAAAATQEDSQRQRHVVRDLEQQLLRRLDLVDGQAAEVASLQDQVGLGGLGCTWPGHGPPGSRAWAVNPAHLLPLMLAGSWGAEGQRAAAGEWVGSLLGGLGACC
jgi:hypothetical protein